MSNNQEKLNEQLFNVIASCKDSDEAKLKKIKYLVYLGADVNAKDEDGRTALMLALKNGQLDAVKYLIKQGANLEAKDKDGKTALMKAAASGKLDVVKYLAENGADLEAKEDWYGMTALMKAAASGKLDVVKCLAECGADLEVKDKDGDMALDHARMWGKADCLKFLEELQQKGESKVEVLSEHKDKAKKEVLEGKAQDEKMGKGSFWQRIFGGRD